ncbi:MAG: Sensor protein KdpD [Candidatus Dichloromethanomonas elyunquensis]|nr:MAG: Sensor protein KdpD [Candidatus Dichloromethanomonas elyunquensis]
MVGEKRVDPDELLASLQKEGYGKLTVFLGAMAGVGKTYAMLETAKERLAEGLDVVVGIVETHKRKDTEAMLQGLPFVPMRIQEYRGKFFQEMDLDAILTRNPQIVLVDELAHTNIPGSRHAKRYQDIEELLAAGINVYTTLNIQHVESYNDIVAQITEIQVRETVPDRILEMASQIQLVDIPPEELIQRLKDGKVYVQGQAQEALKKFFRPGNINALREISMRFAAQRVDQQLESYMRVHGIIGPWPTGEKVLVCIGASPFSAKLIRAAKRMATRLNAEFITAHVETMSHLPKGEAEKEAMAGNLQLAEKLGAEIISLYGKDVAEEILKLARKRNISQIIIGKPERNPLHEWLHGSIVDKVIRNSHGISVHVISGNKEGGNSEAGGKLIKDRPVKPSSWGDISLKPYLWSIFMMVVLTLLIMPFTYFLGTINISMLYLLPVLVSAARWGRKPAIISAVMGIITFDYFFVPPIFSFTVGDIHYGISFVIFILTGIVTGTLSARLKNQVSYSRQREIRVATLYSLSKDIAAVDKLENVLESITRKVADTLEGQVVMLLPDNGGKLILMKSSSPDYFLTDSEQAVATWVFEHGKKAGRGTETLGAAAGLYLPLSIEQGTQGVLGIRLHKNDEDIKGEGIWLLEAYAGLAAMAINRVKLAEEARKSHALAESERLRTALFNSLSHDLRTPLASIIGAATGLLEDQNSVYTPETRKDLLQTILQGAERMNRFVNNLLDMARLESGMLKLNEDWCDIQDVIGVAVSRLGAFLADHPLEIKIPENLPLVQADYILIEQVLINLLDNAQKYSEPGSQITVWAQEKDHRLEISVANRGAGIPEADLSKVFDKFYRLSSPLQVSGTGLGLAICKGIIEVHGGRIWAENNNLEGVTITFTLPLKNKGAEIASTLEVQPFKM